MASNAENVSIWWRHVKVIWLWCMMTSSNGNIFRVTGHVCGEFTGPGEFPAQRPVSHNFDALFHLRPINCWVNNGEAGDLRRYRAHHDVTVMGVTTWTGLPYYWPCVGGIQQSLVVCSRKLPGMWSLGVLFIVILNKQPIEQSSSQRFKTPWRSCDVTTMSHYWPKRDDIL